MFVWLKYYELFLINWILQANIDLCVNDEYKRTYNN